MSLFQYKLLCRLGLTILIAFASTSSLNAADLSTDEQWVCFPAESSLSHLSRDGNGSPILNLTDCRDCLVVIHETLDLDFGSVKFYESKTFTPNNIKSAFLWRFDKIDSEITRVTFHRSKYHPNAIGYYFSRLNGQESETSAEFARLYFPPTVNPFYYDVWALNILEKDHGGDYQCVRSFLSWENEIKNWLEGK